jgi:hypothetical protein
MLALVWRWSPGICPAGANPGTVTATDGEAVVIAGGVAGVNNVNGVRPETFGEAVGDPGQDGKFIAGGTMGPTRGMLNVANDVNSVSPGNAGSLKVGDVLVASPAGGAPPVLLPFPFVLVSSANAIAPGPLISVPPAMTQARAA